MTKESAETELARLERQMCELMAESKRLQDRLDAIRSEIRDTEEDGDLISGADHANETPETPRDGENPA
jgi:hypothetical protein